MSLTVTLERAPLLLSVMVRFELFPDIVVVRLPIGHVSSRDLQLFNTQGSVSEGTDQLSFRTPKGDHISPRASCDRHNQTPITRAAATPMIPNYDSKQTCPDEPHSENGKREYQIVHKHSGRRSVSRGRRNREEMRNCELQHKHDPRGTEKLGSKVQPVPHIFY